MKEKTKGFISEFKEFISRGNVVDMAVGIIVGSAFTAIVNSLVKEVITPLIGWIIGGVDFSQLVLTLPGRAGKPEVQVLIGSFLNQIVSFLIISFVVFLMVKLLNRFRRKKEEAPKAPPAPPADVVLLTEIRDLLRENSK